ncbi:hypothetical protein M427DRAFT_45137 [Gonapodya prolifera JEL478]|uniref:Protein kinase domain-containing protein n=1 Tax=Gonapodya prolifera (strain JEL478) TaxID=1344416 RepID=A0A139ACY1_GONPJ|nr:hypothetical protein M427DRAFT_45137 [Gonapodya prolifera JEL478]|eukprot:KXS14305.1 hypothetical protein M427DRAFT_45137 [Gonapodya prolifera JEL478]
MPNVQHVQYFKAQLDDMPENLSNVGRTEATLSLSIGKEDDWMGSTENEFSGKARTNILLSGLAPFVETLKLLRTNDTLYIVMGFVGLQTVLEYAQALAKQSGTPLQNWNQKHAELEILFVWNLLNIYVLHNLGLAHFDLKPMNMFSGSDAQPIVIEYGSVMKVQPNGQAPFTCAWTQCGRRSRHNC